MIVTCEANFSSAHYIKDHPKCSNVHGHNYKLFVSVKSDILHDGMVMDFGALSALIEEKVIKVLDHRSLVSHLDPVANQFDGCVSLPYNQTTAENLCHWIWVKLSDGIKLHSIKLFETDKYSVTYHGPGGSDDTPG